MSGATDTRPADLAALRTSRRQRRGLNYLQLLRFAETMRDAARVARRNPQTRIVASTIHAVVKDLLHQSRPKAGARIYASDTPPAP